MSLANDGFVPDPAAQAVWKHRPLSGDRMANHDDRHCGANLLSESKENKGSSSLRSFGLQRAATAIPSPQQKERLNGPERTIPEAQ